MEFDGYEFLEDAPEAIVETYIHEYNMSKSIRNVKNRLVLQAHLYYSMVRVFRPKTFKLLMALDKHYEMIGKLKEG